MASLDEWAEKRRQAEERLAGQLDAKQGYLDWYTQDQRDRQEKQRVAEAENWGDEQARGASMGASFGPWGAMIGGALGAAKGQKGAYDERGTTLNPFNVKKFWSKDNLKDIWDVSLNPINATEQTVGGFLQNPEATAAGIQGIQSHQGRQPMNKVPAAAGMNSGSQGPNKAMKFSGDASYNTPSADVKSSTGFDEFNDSTKRKKLGEPKY
jgi:hypothetical protein